MTCRWKREHGGVFPGNSAPDPLIDPEIRRIAIELAQRLIRPTHIVAW
jgi:hypothetical protein